MNYLIVGVVCVLVATQAVATSIIPQEMMIQRNERGRLVIPFWCEEWFDGCNHCRLAENKRIGGVCTSRACDAEAPKQAYCTKRRGAEVK